MTDRSRNAPVPPRLSRAEKIELVRARFDQFRADQQETERTRATEREPERHQRRPARGQRLRLKR